MACSLINAIQHNKQLCKLAYIITQKAESQMHLIRTAHASHSSFGVCNRYAAADALSKAKATAQATLKAGGLSDVVTSAFRNADAVLEARWALILMDTDKQSAAAEALERSVKVHYCKLSLTSKKSFHQPIMHIASPVHAYPAMLQCVARYMDPCLNIFSPHIRIGYQSCNTMYVY